MRITDPGLYDMPEADYHADPCPEPSLSSTLARLMVNRSPRHAWTASPRLNPDHEPVNKETFDVGRAAHAVLLGRGAPIARPRGPQELRDGALGVGVSCGDTRVEHRRAQQVDIGFLQWLFFQHQVEQPALALCVDQPLARIPGNLLGRRDEVGEIRLDLAERYGGCQIDARRLLPGIERCHGKISLA